MRLLLGELNGRTGFRRWAAVAVGSAAVLLAHAVAVAGASGRAGAASVPACSTQQLAVWLGDGEGGGTAGSIYYPLEFTNVGHSSCTLEGYPGVSAFGLGAKQIGPAGTRITAGSHGTVTLAPNATAHALIAIVGWGALCGTAQDALGLKVYPPNQKSAQTISFPFEACPHESVIRIEPVRSGVGIPGYTGS